ncbi:MAG: nucleotidyltransferase domain-containing protein [Bacillota bacterium]|nr:nucleotidyltransferase domain-containing protein [Bacillota bacterium]
MKGRYTVNEIKKIVTPIAEEYGVESLSLFGSYSKGTAALGSDVDFLIEKGALRGLFALSGFRLALEDALELPVDLITRDISDKSFLDMIAGDEVLLYRSAR